MSMSHAEQRYFGTWPHPVGQHAGAGKDSVGNEKAETQTLPCLAGHSQTSSAWQWSLFSMRSFENRQKDDQASLWRCSQHHC